MPAGAAAPTEKPALTLNETFFPSWAAVFECNGQQ